MEPPSIGQIHVLVVVPEGTAGSASETSVSKMIEEIYAETVLKKRKFPHSQMNLSDWVKIADELGIEVILVDTLDVAAGEGTRVDPFDWAHVARDDQDIPLTEEQQRDSYREYVEENIGDVLTKKELCVIGVDKKQSILIAKVRDIEFVGSADLLILSDTVKKDTSSLQVFRGVQMLIEVKEKFEPDNELQALSELVALDFRAIGPVMAILTDLNEEWVFFWVAEKKGNSVQIHRALIDNPGEGFKAIRTLLEQSSAGNDTEIEIPYFDECNFKHCALQQRGSHLLA